MKMTITASHGEFPTRGTTKGRIDERLPPHRPGFAISRAYITAKNSFSPTSTLSPQTLHAVARPIWVPHLYQESQARMLATVGHCYRAARSRVSWSLAHVRRCNSLPRWTRVAFGVTEATRADRELVPSHRRSFRASKFYEEHSSITQRR